MTHAVIAWTSVLYESVEHRAKAVTPSAKLNHVRPFPGLFSSFFSLIESEIFEQASREIATEEPTNVFKICQAP